MLPHVVGMGEDGPALHPDQLLMDEEAVCLPRLLDEGLAGGGMELVDGRVGGQGFGQGDFEELAEELAPRRLPGSRPSACP